MPVQICLQMCASGATMQCHVNHPLQKNTCLRGIVTHLQRFNDITKIMTKERREMSAPAAWCWCWTMQQLALFPTLLCLGIRETPGKATVARHREPGAGLTHRREGTCLWQAPSAQISDWMQRGKGRGRRGGWVCTPSTPSTLQGLRLLCSWTAHRPCTRSCKKEGG